ncbi:MAG: DUF3667 domain-containing protein [Pseudoxanthomonas sp.]
MTQPDHAAGHHAPVHCENCHATLQGEFCHQCGQSIHNPVRHAGHAIEEVFESFWHLDGRVFRTLRDLLWPGRTAMEYLAGHRQRYLPPLRIFVIMSLLAFFVGKLLIHPQSNAQLAEIDVAPIVNSQTVQEVERNRDKLLAELEQARKEAGQVVPGVDAFVIASQVRVQGEANNRIAQLRPGGAPPAPAAGGGGDNAVDTAALGRRKSSGALFSSDNEVWDPAKNPARVDWLPGFANDWLNRKLTNGKENAERMGTRLDAWFQAFMGSLPSALFLLVPLFALMLKLAYVFKRRLYMEHLVVALYSHVFLLMALTVMFVLMAASGWVDARAHWLSVALNLATVGLLLWMPVYLLLMQKRVYGQGWPMTLVKYGAIGFVYVNLLMIVATVMFLVTLAKD